MASLTPFGRLQPSDTGLLRDLLYSSFNTPFAMTALLQTVSKQFNTYYGMNANLPEAIQQVIDGANSEDWWRALVVQARIARPGNPALSAFAEQFDLAPAAYRTTADGMVGIARGALQGTVHLANPMLDIAVWRTRLGEVESRVCRIECPEGRHQGTGFLVGPDVVITAFHVVEKVIGNVWNHKDVAVRFDYKALANGVTVSSGKTYKLAGDWLIDSSTYSTHDVTANSSGVPCEDELDYALLRIEGTPGADPLPGTAPGVPRGWIAVPGAAEAPDFEKQKALFIVQHPQGRPMQVALDTDSIIEVAGGGTRLRYRTNTEPSSSGSPCFGVDWQWVALHHSGDPANPWPAKPVLYNQGILVSSIVKLLERRNKRGALGGAQQAGA